jgi:hypothetical protein
LFTGKAVYEKVDNSITDVSQKGNRGRIHSSEKKKTAKHRRSTYILRFKDGTVRKRQQPSTEGALTS